MVLCPQFGRGRSRSARLAPADHRSAPGTAGDGRGGTQRRRMERRGEGMSAAEAGADDAGIAAMRPQWVFEGYEAPRERWVVVIAVAHDYDKIRAAPEEAAAAEVIRQYARGNRIAKALASWLRAARARRGPARRPDGRPDHADPARDRLRNGRTRQARLADPPPARRELPPRFRAYRRAARRGCAGRVRRRRFLPPLPGLRGRLPARGDRRRKQLVRGEKRWYVDFDKCLPYFNETQGCAICIAVCPWSRPGVAETLVEKMARRRARP